MKNVTSGPSYMSMLYVSGMTIYQVVDLFITYYGYPVSISVNMTSASALPFPEVTICNVNPVRYLQLSSLG